MPSAGDVVQGFMSALGKGDFATARKFLHDNLSFRGPIDAFDEPEPYLQATEKRHKMVERVDMKMRDVSRRCSAPGKAGGGRAVARRDETRPLQREFATRETRD